MGLWLEGNNTELNEKINFNAYSTQADQDDKVKNLKQYNASLKEIHNSIRDLRL